MKGPIGKKKDKFSVIIFFVTIYRCGISTHYFIFILKIRNFISFNTTNAPKLFPRRNLHDPNQCDDDMWQIYSQRYTCVFSALGSEVQREGSTCMVMQWEGFLTLPCAV